MAAANQVLKDKLKELSYDAVRREDTPNSRVLKELLQQAANTAALHPRRSGVAHIWEEYRKQLRSFQKEPSSTKALRTVVSKALRAIDTFHPESIEEHKKTRAHHAAISDRIMEELRTQKKVVSEHVPRDPLRAFLNAVLEGKTYFDMVNEGLIPAYHGGIHPSREARADAFQQAVDYGLARSAPKERYSVTDLGRAYLRSGKLPARKTTIEKLVKGGRFRVPNTSYPGVWFFEGLRSDASTYAARNDALERTELFPSKVTVWRGPDPIPSGE